MSDWRHIGTAWDGTSQYHRTDENGNVQLLTQHQDVSGVLERNKRLAGVDHGNGKDMKLAASVPLSLIAQWKQEHGLEFFSNEPEHKKLRRRLLNDHQYKMLRVWQGDI